MARIRVVKSISISKEKWEELKTIASEENRTASNMIEYLIELYQLRKI